MLTFSVLATISTIDPAGTHKPELMSGDAVMVVLTWVTFLGLLFILQKFAWGPIIATLESREKTIRNSLQKAEDIQKELDELEQFKKRIISEAKYEASAIIEDSRKKAVANAHIIESQAKEQARSILESAQESIESETQRVRMALRKESVTVAVNLASRLIKEELDEVRSQRLVEEYIKEI